MKNMVIILVTKTGMFFHESALATPAQERNSIKRESPPARQKAKNKTR